MGQGFAAKAEIKQVFSVEGVGIKVDMQRFKQLCESGGEQLLTGDFVLFKLPPEILVDRLIKLVSLVGEGEIVCLKGADECLMFGIGEVHQGFVRIDEKNIIFHEKTSIARFLLG